MRHVAERISMSNLSSFGFGNFLMNIIQCVVVSDVKVILQSISVGLLRVLDYVTDSEIQLLSFNLRISDTASTNFFI